MINGQIAIIAICPFSYYMYKIFRTYKENAMSWINIADITYPIGSYYISNNNTPPAEIFEGSWERVEGGLCLTSIGSYTWTSTDLTDSSGAILATTGGSMGAACQSQLVKCLRMKDIYFLTLAIMVLVNYAAYLKNSVLTTYGSSGRGWNLHNSDECTPAGQTLGSGAAYIPKHIGVIVWKRIA